jgi:adenylate cyclase
MSAARRLAAILAVDVAGYSRLMGEDEAGTARAVREHREAARPIVAGHGGRIVKTMGDGVLLEFPSVVAAVECAIAVQKLMVERNADVPEGKRIVYRMGVHLGDVLIEDEDIIGEGVNIAARLEGIAEPGAICLSGSAFEHVRGRIEASFVDLGEKELKHIARPVRVYQVNIEPVRIVQTVSELLSPTLSLPDKPSLAVLPFQNMSGDPEQEYFADGVVEDIITALSRVRSFFVIARNSSFTYKGKAVDVKQVGRELGVRYVIEGSVRKASGRVRITCQLIEADSNRHVWADRFEGNLEDIFDLQDQVTESVVGAIEPTLQRAEIERATSKPTDNLAAYDLYLRALPYLYSGTKVSTDKALQMLNRAVSVDPDYSLAKATSALCYNYRIAQLFDFPGDREEGLRLAREALDSHRDDPTTLGNCAAALGYLGHEFDTARQAIDRAIELNPNSAANLARKGYIEYWMNNPEIAEKYFRRSLRLSPLDIERGITLLGLALVLSYAYRYEEALQVSQAILAERPSTLQAYVVAIGSLFRLGRLEEARAFKDKLLQLSPDFTISKFHRNIAGIDEERRRRFVETFRAVGFPD